MLETLFEHIVAFLFFGIKKERKIRKEVNVGKMRWEIKRAKKKIRKVVKRREDVELEDSFQL